MSDSLPTLLWKRLTSALVARGINVSSSQGDVAAQARTRLGTELVERFLNSYYLERQYGGGNSELTDAQAEMLVRQIEQLPPWREVAPTPPVVAAALVVEDARVIAGEPAAWDGPVLEEAEAYGEGARTGSALDAIRQIALEMRANRAARRRERQRHSAARVEAGKAAAAARERANDEAAVQRARRNAAELEKARREAEEEKQRRVRAAADVRESALQKAGNLRSQGNGRAAVRLLENLVRQQPDSAVGWFTLAWYFGSNGNYRRSTRCYKRGLRLDPSDKTAWNNLGHDLRGMRRYRNSAGALREALALDGEYVTAWANLGTTLREQKDFRGAAQAFFQVVRRRESEAAAWYWLGHCLAARRDYRGAVDALQRASQTHPDNVTLWMELGHSLRQLGRENEAEEALAQARRLGVPSQKIGIEVPILVLAAIAASIAKNQWQISVLALVSVAAFLFMVARLSLGRVKLFWVAFTALPLLALQFTDFPYVAPVGMGILLISTLLIARIWKYRRAR